MLRIGMAQINPIVGDLNGNGQKIIHYISKARDMGVDILSFPELAICGYPPEDLVFKPHFVEDNIKTLKEIIKYTADITVIIGFIDTTNDGNIYNAAGLCRNQRLISVYHKMNLPNYGVFDEKRHFEQGHSPLVFTLNETVIGINICEDIWTEDGIANLQSAGNRAEIVMNISASPYHVGKGNLRKEILTKQAVNNGVMVCYNNLVGGQDELIFDGSSMIIDQRGEVIAHGKQFEEDLIIIELPAAKPQLFPQLEELDEIYHALMLGTHDYVYKNRFKKVIIGLSGGIDSALVASIAVDALGRENVVGISMPSQYSSQETQGDAQRLAKNLGIEFHVVPIMDIFETYIETFKQGFDSAKLPVVPVDVTNENLQARIRGNILMAYSNKFGFLVLTTGNKSETGVGYCTLYGDMAGGFAVIKDVPKTLVYRLAQYRNAKGIVIPQGILTRPPSAELKEDQKDEDTLPPYEILDSILEAYVEKDKSIKQIIELGFESEMVKRVIRMVDISEYKRRQSPPGIKITPKAFGKDRRLPIT
ncbi:MAG: NAD+ synthase, partial [Candidatus Desantisbacteria bacterium]